MKAWCGNKPLCTKGPYDLGKLEVNKVAPNTRTEHIQKWGPEWHGHRVYHYYIKLQETSSINHTNHTRLVVGFWDQQNTMSSVIK
jgi:hypothetical protein